MSMSYISVLYGAQDLKPGERVRWKVSYFKDVTYCASFLHFSFIGSAVQKTILHDIFSETVISKLKIAFLHIKE